MWLPLSHFFHIFIDKKEMSSLGFVNRTVPVTRTVAVTNVPSITFYMVPLNVAPVISVLSLSALLIVQFDLKNEQNLMWVSNF